MHQARILDYISVLLIDMSDLSDLYNTQGATNIDTGYVLLAGNLVPMRYSPFVEADKENK